MAKAATEAKNKYNALVYDRINVFVTKGQKEELKAIAQAHHESLNGFVNRAIKERLMLIKAAENENGTEKTQ
jgi:predicted HicB family RNase H-like nuclease